MNFLQQVSHHVEGTKRGWTLVFSPDIVAAAQQKIIIEFLDAIEGALDRELNIVCGDINLMSEEYVKLFKLYESWDLYNRGARRTSAELVEEHKDDTWEEQDVRHHPI